MKTNVRIRKVDTSALRRRFAAMSRRSQDFRPVFKWVLKELQKAHLANFTREGTVDGAPWKPLDPQYASWKLSNYGANGILVADGSLRRSLTVDSSRGAVRDVGFRTATFGTQIPYAKFHQSGTRFMAERKPVFLPSLMPNQTATVVGEYIVHGSVGVRYAAALKGFVI